MKEEINKTEKGFTLIELMIVVAIIGILAAIAIPQFSSYRVKAFNAAALSDLHTVKLAEESQYADSQTYGKTAAASATVAQGTGAAVAVGSAFIGTNALGLSKNVKADASTDSAGTTYIAAAGHLQGNLDYGFDSDAAPTYKKTKTAGSAHAAHGLTPASGDQLSAASGWSVL